VIKTLGIDVGGTYIKTGIVTTPPQVEKFKSTPTQVNNLVGELLEIISQYKVKAVGIGVAGLIRDGTIHSSPNFSGIKNLKLREILQSKLKIPILVENDANMIALGEWKYGRGRGVSNLLLLTLGTGVGGGLILENKLYKGTGFAGEVGHITIDPNGPPCGCGNYGCLESFVGSKALEQKAYQGIRVGVKTSLSKYKTLTPEIITQEAYKGDKFACTIIESMGRYLGIGIASLCNVLAPECVIIGGGIAKAGKILFSRIEEEVKIRLYHKEKVKIVPPELGDYAGILGSAYYASYENYKD
jgi:glucokinase